MARHTALIDASRPFMARGYSDRTRDEAPGRYEDLGRNVVCAAGRDFVAPFIHGSVLHYTTSRPMMPLGTRLLLFSLFSAGNFQRAAGLRRGNPEASRALKELNSGSSPTHTITQMGRPWRTQLPFGYEIINRSVIARAPPRRASRQACQQD